MKTTTTTSTTYVPTGTNAEPNYHEYCWYRLPCGICTRTNEFCPLSGNSKVTPSWLSGTIVYTNATGTGTTDATSCMQSKNDVWHVDLDGKRFSTFSDKVERALKEVQE